MFDGIHRLSELILLKSAPALRCKRCSLVVLGYHSLAFSKKLWHGPYLTPACQSQRIGLRGFQVELNHYLYSHSRLLGETRHLTSMGPVKAKVGRSGHRRILKRVLFPSVLHPCSSNTQFHRVVESDCPAFHRAVGLSRSPSTKNYSCEGR